MGSPPVRRDDQRALASLLSYVQVDKQSTTYAIVDLPDPEIFRAQIDKFGKISGHSFCG